jgi:predicted GNAT family N-acyltransferase
VQHALWTDPAGYYFCNIVAVQPDAQGRGIGRQLFKAVTDRADAEGRRCYLESSRDEPNIRIYERMGFRLMQGLECDDGGVVCKVRFFPARVRLDGETRERRLRRDHGPS